jgi:uncharacterized OsmC-like protein
MTSTVVYEGDLRTNATHLQSSTAIETDAPTDNNGKGERFSPTDLLATSLASCMITIMGIKARTMDIDIEGIRADVEKIMKAEPRRVSGININFHIPDTLKTLDEKSRTILKNAANSCPVMHSIHPDIHVEVDWKDWK